MPKLGHISKCLTSTVTVCLSIF